MSASKDDGKDTENTNVVQVVTNSLPLKSARLPAAHVKFYTHLICCDRMYRWYHVAQQRGISNTLYITAISNTLHISTQRPCYTGC